MALCWGIARGGGRPAEGGGGGQGQGQEGNSEGGGGGGQANTTNALYYIAGTGGIESFSHQAGLPSNGLLMPI